MIFEPQRIADVVLVRLDRHGDQRGWFARSYCTEEFREAGIAFEVVQANISRNVEPSTLRGLHFQAAPFEEPKLVRATRGRLFDVAVDLRPDSATRCQWVGAELDADTGDALYIPSGFAHGFLTLTADTEISYLMGAAYQPSAARGVRWNDPAFGISWPAEPQVIADRDRDWPDYGPAHGIA